VQVFVDRVRGAAHVEDGDGLESPSSRRMVPWATRHTRTNGIG
jgi:hypothetical protein